MGNPGDPKNPWRRTLQLAHPPMQAGEILRWPHAQLHQGNHCLPFTLRLGSRSFTRLRFGPYHPGGSQGFINTDHGVKQRVSLLEVASGHSIIA
jgi:hypothetical protein